jgi:hypothetical protein
MYLWMGHYCRVIESVWGWNESVKDIYDSARFQWRRGSGTATTSDQDSGGGEEGRQMSLFWNCYVAGDSSNGREKRGDEPKDDETEPL